MAISTWQQHIQKHQTRVHLQNNAFSRIKEKNEGPTRYCKDAEHCIHAGSEIKFFPPRRVSFLGLALAPQGQIWVGSMAVEVACLLGEKL